MEMHAEQPSSPPATRLHVGGVASMCEVQAEKWVRSGDAQFLTPVRIAQYMASMFATATKGPHTSLRILDPGAGLGILAAAALDSIIAADSSSSLRLVTTVELVLVDQDEATCTFLRERFSSFVTAAASSCGRHLVVTTSVIQADFLELAESWTRKTKERFDVVLSNPPYFKLNSDDARVVAASAHFGKQTNIYSLFMSYAAELLRPEGILVFIVPRSFTAGVYFNAFRCYFLNRISINRLHVFASRTEAFGRDSVLQENLILCGTRSTQKKDAFDVIVSTSQGASDIATSLGRTVPVSTVLWIPEPGSAPILRLPVALGDDALCDLFDQLPFKLEMLGLRVATGPAIAFRCREQSVFNGRTAWPFLWMEHVHPFCISWPNSAKESHPQYVKAQNTTAVTNITVEVQNMVIIRRFSAKEQERRMIVAPLLQRDFASYPRLALENHLNFICAANGERIDETIVLGLASYLSSSIVDAFFRISNGNTQVSAAELRQLPMPPMSVLHTIGIKIMPRFVDGGDRSQLLTLVDRLVEATVREFIQEQKRQKIILAPANRPLATPVKLGQEHESVESRQESTAGGKRVRQSQPIMTLDSWILKKRPNA